MEVLFKNTGIIKEADIRFDGLTVIAGENDTGKSTVCKLLFAIIKNLSAIENDDTIQDRKIKNFDDMLNGEMVSKYSADGMFSIQGKKDKTPIFKITGNDFCSTLKLMAPLDFEDATFLESPVWLDMPDNIRFSKTRYRKDLLLKLTEIIPTNSPPMDLECQDIINGKFYYNFKRKDFVFEKDSRVFKGQAVSSGVKYLGALGILAQAGILHKKSLLIMDAPENYIHPKWQLWLAMKVIRAINAGAHILVTSQSAIMVEALKLLSDKYVEKKKATFYLTERAEGSSQYCIDDVSYDVTPIFEQFAEPYNKLEEIEAGLIS